MENWLPAIHSRDVLHRVELSRADHRVQTKRGKTFGITLVTIRYTLIEEAGAQWQLRMVGMAVNLDGPFIMRDDLAHIPPWLLDLERRTLPTTGEAG